MKAFTVIPCDIKTHVKARNHFGGIEYIPVDAWERLSLATADTRDHDFWTRYRASGSVVGMER